MQTNSFPRTPTRDVSESLALFCFATGSEHAHTQGVKQTASSCLVSLNPLRQALLVFRKHTNLILLLWVEKMWPLVGGCCHILSSFSDCQHLDEQWMAAHRAPPPWRRQEVQMIWIRWDERVAIVSFAASHRGSSFIWQQDRFLFPLDCQPVLKEAATPFGCSIAALIIRPLTAKVHSGKKSPDHKLRHMNVKFSLALPVGLTPKSAHSPPLSSVFRLSHTPIRKKDHCYKHK